MTRPYVLDVSGYQPDAAYYAFWDKWAGRGVKGAIVKLTESTNYVNPSGAGQIAAAKHEGMTVSGYHFSRFWGNSYQAVDEAHFAIAQANAMGLPQGATFALDYEEELGERGANTQAAIAFLKCIKAAGFAPAFYSYSGMAKFWDFDAIHNATGAMLWIAAYPTKSGVTAPAMDWFPSISDHTGAWQFTDNFYGEHIDASIDLTGIFTGAVQQAPSKVTAGGHIDSVAFNGDKLKIEGWFASDQAKGKENRYVILTSEDEKQEYARVKVDSIARPDVAKTFPDIPGGDQSGFSAEFPYTPALAGKKVLVVVRYTDDPDGNGNPTDYTSLIELNQSGAYFDSVNTVVFANKLKISSWFASDLSLGLKNRFMILLADGKEVQRIKVDPVARPDVAKANPALYGADQSGFTGEFSYSGELVGKSLQLVDRFSDDERGEGHHVDYWFKPFNGPAMPVIDGKTETEVLVHTFSAEPGKDGLISLKFK